LQWRIRRFEGRATRITPGSAKCTVTCSVSCLKEDVKKVERKECGNI
jgi:hypothetical protein